MDGLLSGLKVLDFTYLLPGPFATMVLADLGADVIRVESPTRIDMVRILPPFVDRDGKVSALHAYLNRSKKSIALDLKNKESISVIERLIDNGYDIIVEQFRPGVMERLGLSYDRLKSVDPSIIYCSITGYGQTGPFKDRAGHDINYLSLSGIMGYSGRKDTGPCLMGVQMADIGSGSYNTIVSILAAVISRLNTGQGQYIDVAMADGLFPYNAVQASTELAGGDRSGYETEVLNGGSLYGFYETADSRYISFGGLEQQFFTEFCKALGVEDLADGGVMQFGKLEEARERISGIIRSKPLEFWIERFKKVDACVEPVLRLSEALESEYAKAKDLVVNVPGPDGNPVPQLAHPVKFSNFKPRYRKTGGKLGEDTKAILRSLGYDEERVKNMEKKGVFG